MQAAPGQAAPGRDRGSRHAAGRRRLFGAAVTAALVVAGSATLAGTTNVLAAAGPALSLDATADVHPISPYIYGMAYASTAVTSSLHTPIQRWGGDGTTRYNWRVDSSNAGGDWYFTSGSGNADPVPSAGPDALEAEAKSISGTTLMTIPMIPWINSSATWNCSFPTPPYPSQTAYNPYVRASNGAKCGNGIDAATGKDLTDTDIVANNTANTPGLQEQWVQHLVSKFGDAAQGGVAVYEMDNEPSGWNNTHRDVHPALTGWDELVNDTEEYAAAVKAADPTAAVDGPGDFGFPALIDMGPSGDNRASHGGSIWEAQYYLQQLAAYQRQHGVRLLDYFDEHYYPITPSGVDGCIALCPAGDANNQAARLQSTRSLWDPTYVENDWIGQWYGATDYLGRMQSYVDQYYPGTKLAISEYNFGGLESINGALAEADVLGIFGQYGVGLASLWSPPSLGQPGYFSFRMYQDYDGRGGRFGDMSVQATSSNRSAVAVYGATRTSDGALTVMVINKTGTDLTSPLSIAGFAPASTAQVYTYDSSDLSAIVRQPDASSSGDSISATYPADSITLLVIPKASTPPSSSSTSTSAPSSVVTSSSVPPTTAATSTSSPGNNVVGAGASQGSQTTTSEPGAGPSGQRATTTLAAHGATSKTAAKSPSNGLTAAKRRRLALHKRLLAAKRRRLGDHRTPIASRLAVRFLVPDHVRQGSTGAQVLAAGRGFVVGDVAAVSGTGVSVRSLRVESTGRISIVLRVTRSAPAGARTLTIRGRGRTAGCRGCLHVLKAAGG